MGSVACLCLLTQHMLVGAHVRAYSIVLYSVLIYHIHTVKVPGVAYIIVSMHVCVYVYVLLSTVRV